MKKLNLSLFLTVVLASALFSCASSKTDENNNNNITNNNNNNTNNPSGLCSSYCPADKVCVGSTPEHSTCVSPCPCPADRMCYNGGCVDLFTDENNCGAGGVYCSGTCTNGQCSDACAASGTACLSTQTCCEISTNYYSCVNTSGDVNNCGDCGNTCDSTAANACVNGQCACGTNAACTGGKTCCSNSCKDLLNDPYNCGTCGRACGIGLACVNGQCMCGSEACDASESCCGNYCADLNNDSTNCGECGTNCGTGNGCSQGDCTCGTSGQVCRESYTSEMLMNCLGEMDPTAMMGVTCHEECCGNGCAVTSASTMMGGALADPDNCGECGNTCTGGGVCCCFDLMGTGASCECCSAGETCSIMGCEASGK